MTREKALERLEEIVMTIARLENNRDQLLEECRDLRKIVLAELIVPEKRNKHPLQKRSSKPKQGATQEIVLRTFSETGKNEMSPREVSDYAAITSHAAYSALGALARRGLLQKNRDGFLTTYELVVHPDKQAH